MHVIRMDFDLRAQCFLLSLMMLALVGCQANYEDKSEIMPFEDIVGKRLKTNMPVTAYGINESLNRDGPVDYVELRPEPIEGPEIVFSRPVGTGMVITIERVLVAEYFGRTLLKYQVNTADEGLKSYKVILPASEKYESGNIGLDSSVYTEIRAGMN